MRRASFDATTAERNRSASPSARAARIYNATPGRSESPSAHARDARDARDANRRPSIDRGTAGATAGAGAGAGAGSSVKSSTSTSERTTSNRSGSPVGSAAPRRPSSKR